ncbi:MAG: hypothetical protein ACKVOE_09360 [Rickettsiales bacterium]
MPKLLRYIDPSLLRLLDWRSVLSVAVLSILAVILLAGLPHWVFRWTFGWAFFLGVIAVLVSVCMDDEDNGIVFFLGALAGILFCWAWSASGMPYISVLLFWGLLIGFGLTMLVGLVFQQEEEQKKFFYGAYAVGGWGMANLLAWLLLSYLVPGVIYGLRHLPL